MKHFIWLVVTAMVLTACGNSAERLAEEAAERALESEGGGDVDIELGEDGEEGSIVVETEEGTQSMSFGSGELPDGLTLPVMDGYEVIGSTVMQQEGGSLVNAQLEYPDAGLDDLVSFYEDHFSTVGDALLNTSQSGSGDSQTYSWFTESAQVTVSRIEVDGPILVTLNQGS